MFRAILCTILLVSVVTGGAISKISEIPENVDVKFVLVDDISKLEDFKRGDELIPMKCEQRFSEIRYTLGNRVPDDILVAQVADNYTFAGPKNVQLTLSYPSSGEGAVLTFVEILVIQSSSLGQAYVISGGIGKRYITIAVEAYITIQFNFKASFYGEW